MSLIHRAEFYSGQAFWVEARPDVLESVTIEEITFAAEQGDPYAQDCLGHNYCLGANGSALLNYCGRDPCFRFRSHCVFERLGLIYYFAHLGSCRCLMLTISSKLIKKEPILCRVPYRKSKSNIIHSRIAVVISVRSLLKRQTFTPHNAWSCPCLTFRRGTSFQPISQPLILCNEWRQPKGDWQLIQRRRQPQVIILVTCGVFVRIPIRNRC